MEALVLRDSITGSMTDEEFLRFCVENPGLRIERNSNLEIIIMSPVSSLSGLYSSEIFGQLYIWNKSHGRGIVFDASTGFTLPDRSVFSPDAAWILKEKWDNLSNEDKNKFAFLSPDFIIEVRSKSDHLEDLKKKMGVWIKNGIQLAWLIDPVDKVSFIFRRDGSIQKIDGFGGKIKGEKPVEGFELDLTALPS
jgi:Uma2 family endonuclease